METIGRNLLTERPLFFLTLPRISDGPKALTLHSKYFGCFLACNAERVSDEEIINLANLLLKQGLVYFCAWGADCERVHDLFDTAVIECNPHETKKSVIITTWHDDESLDEALWYFLNAAFPAEDYSDDCQAEVVIVVGNDAWARQIEKRLADQESLERDVAGEEDDDTDPAA